MAEATMTREDLEDELEAAAEAVREAAENVDGEAAPVVEAVEAVAAAFPLYAEAEAAEREARDRVLELRRKLGARPDGQAPSVSLPDGPEARLQRSGGRLAVELANALRKAAERGELPS